MTDRGWTLFHASQLAVRAPAYLRQRRSMMFMEAPKKRRAGQNVTMFSLGALTHPSQLDAHRWKIESFDPRIAQPGTELILVRRGKPDWLDDGLELLTKMRILSTGEVTYGLDVLLNRSGISWIAYVGGDGELAAFDRDARSIVRSIRVLEGVESKTPAKRSRSRAGGLDRADTARLKEVIKNLPPELTYLRKPILNIARQDQDLLGSGEADTAQLDTAISGQSAKCPDGFAASHAEQLKKWLDSTPGTEGRWAAPAWFVQAYLLGYDVFHQTAE